ncbi:putative quinol monooxygenase [Novosphingobium kaempferiae]|uniref:putative quinol monooxygenase n=1 Tax=Novosphingobium kaempferiae TaxID=2896849 RepID=UPI001E3A3DD5|nr:antibiotic biosynthesis monooxygenase family protein [Novosphingobium kaempferiae]
MISDRRTVVIGAAAMALLLTGNRPLMEEIDEDSLFGLIGQIKASPGKRDELVGYLIEGSGKMPGNIAYRVWKDREDADAVWIVEVWETEAAHKASLSLPQVREAIRKARPIIAGFGVNAKVTPAGGMG